MTQDEIIAMAREAGFDMSRLPSIRAANVYGEVNDELARFAALVAEKAAAKEREACAKVCELMRTVPPNGEPEDVERGFNAALRRSAAAIRARGPKESV